MRKTIGKRRTTASDGYRKGLSLKSVARALVYNALGAVLWCANHVIRPSQHIILLYHKQRATSFERQLRHLRRFYRIISLEELVFGREALEGSRPLAAITFDDGLANNYEILKSLKRRGIPATLFLTTGYVGKGVPLWPVVSGETGLDDLKGAFSYESCLAHLERGGAAADPDDVIMTEDQLRDIDGGSISIAPHTRSHPFLTELAGPDLLEEVQGSIDDIRRYRSHVDAVFAPPFGDYDASTLSVILSRTEVRAVVSIEPGVVSRGEVPKVFRRIGIPDSCGLGEFVFRANGLQAKVNKLLGR